MKLFWGFLLSLLFLTEVFLAQAQNDDLGEKEESNIPKKVLRKYRIRRPVILDENGNAVSTPSVPRLRRIRVNKPQQPAEGGVSRAVSSGNSLDTGNVYSSYNFQSPQPQALAQRQSIYEEQQPEVLEPIRVVPTYRKATPSSTRSALLANVNYKDRGVTGEEETKKQPIGTTRNYSRINEDGSFTFGYEGEDGSFKEETRGTDCVVRGKYGYVDPDGVQREFSYVSGNPCDPNNPDKDDGEEQDEVTIPVRVTPSSRPRRPVINQNVQQNLDAPPVPQAVPVPSIYRAGQRQRIQPTPPPPPQFQQPTTFRPRIRLTPQSSTPPPPPPPPSPFQLQQLHGRSSQSTFRQPSLQILDERGANRAFDFDQELQRIHQFQAGGPSAVPPQQQGQAYQPQFHQFQPQYQQFQPQPQPQPTQPTPPRFGPGSVHRFPHRQYFGGSNAPNLFQQTQQPPTPTPTLQQVQQRPTPAPFQLQQQPTPAQYHQPRPVLPQPQVDTNSIQEGGIDYSQYRTELVFDPSTGRYMSVYVQDAPKEEEQLTLTQRLRGFVEPKRPDQPSQQFQIQMFGQPQVQYYTQPQQQQFQHQQPQHQFQHQHYQRPQFQHQYHQFQPSTGSITSLHADAQEAINSPASGQIEAFLSNLNIPS